jgi:type I restriction enzyme M protein
MAINGDNGEMEKELWESAEKLRGPVEAAEYRYFPNESRECCLNTTK